MEFNELIETLTAVIALGKAAGAAAKPLRKPVGEVLHIVLELNWSHRP